MFLAYNDKNQDGDPFFENFIVTILPCLLTCCIYLLLNNVSEIQAIIANGEIVFISLSLNLVTITYFVTQNAYSKYTSVHFFVLLFALCLTLLLYAFIKSGNIYPKSISFISATSIIFSLIIDYSVFKRIKFFKNNKIKITKTKNKRRKKKKRR